MLAGLLCRHRGQLSADLRRFYSCNLSDVMAGAVAPARDVAAWVANLPPDSAVGRVFDPYLDERTTTNELLRLIEHGVRVVAWVGSQGKRHDYPRPLRFPWDERAGEVWRGDALDWDDAVDALGGDDRLAAVMARLTT